MKEVSVLMILDGLDGLDGCSISVLERLALQMVYSKATAQKMKEVFKVHWTGPPLVAMASSVLHDRTIPPRAPEPLEERQRCRQKGEDLPPDCDPFLLKTFKKHGFE